MVEAVPLGAYLLSQKVIRPAYENGHPGAPRIIGEADS